MDQITDKRVSMTYNKLDIFETKNHAHCSEAEIFFI